MIPLKMHLSSMYTHITYKENILIHKYRHICLLKRIVFKKDESVKHSKVIISCEKKALYSTKLIVFIA